MYRVYDDLYYIGQVLVSHGASVNEQDNIGNTPLHLGQSYSCPILNILLSCLLACTAGHVGVVTVLLRAGLLYITSLLLNL